MIIEKPTDFVKTGECASVNEFMLKIAGTMSDFSGVGDLSKLTVAEIHQKLFIAKRDILEPNKKREEIEDRIVELEIKQMTEVDGEKYTRDIYNLLKLRDRENGKKRQAPTEDEIAKIKMGIYLCTETAGAIKNAPDKKIATLKGIAPRLQTVEQKIFGFGASMKPTREHLLDAIHKLTNLDGRGCENVLLTKVHMDLDNFDTQEEIDKRGHARLLNMQSALKCQKYTYTNDDKGVEKYVGEGISNIRYFAELELQSALQNDCKYFTDEKFVLEKMQKIDKFKRSNPREYVRSLVNDLYTQIDIINQTNNQMGR
jgi:hypothetical protein